MLAALVGFTAALDAYIKWSEGAGSAERVSMPLPRLSNKGWKGGTAVQVW